MKNTIKVLGIVALIAVIGFSFAACDTGSSGGGGGGGGGSGELWSKLMAGDWAKDGSSLVMRPNRVQEINSTYGYCELVVAGVSGRVYVKLNSVTGYWNGNLPASKNISFGGGSSSTGLVTFSSDTQMTISNTTGNTAQLAGSYTRQ
jgi:hypothetical protein